MKPDFVEYLRSKVLLGDGAIGTYLYSKGIELGKDTDRLNITDPDLIYSIHEEYIRAGSQLIETNTFGASRFKLQAAGLGSKTREINLAGAAIARRAAGSDIYVAGSIGPTGVEFPLETEEANADDIESTFKEQIETLLEGEVDILLFETFTYLDELLLAVKTARQITDVPIVAQMAYPSKGKTAHGVDALTCGMAAMEAGADVVGGNCGRGVTSLLTAIQHLTPLKDRVPLSAFPNAGFPEIVGHRMVYPAQPAYMGQILAEMIKLGVRLVGGCCGTAPTHIHEFRQLLRIKRRPLAKIETIQGEADLTTIKEEKTAGYGQLLRGLQPDRLPVFVELDPPTHLDVGGVIDGAHSLKKNGADVVTLGENPLAVLRCDNLALAHRIQQEVDIPSAIHLTCRDRNILGLQSQIMGAHTLGIKGILAVTGDPATSSDQPGVSGVFDVKSFGLIRTINLFNQGRNLAGRDMKKKTDFSIGGAFSFRPSRPEVQIRRLERKAALGASFIMTQPLFDADTVEKMVEQTSHLDLLILPGIFPLISARNADFLHNEVPGISIPEETRKKLWRYEKVEDQRKAAMEITWNLISSIASFVDGLYLISPLNKWDITATLTRDIRKAGWSGSGRVARFTS
ncbi:MAG: bifunctional homocysteine S-methyltransferase/methylenetetrahydrofolate reductase [Thermodesulfobacteriota bacterium]|nr:bifunctional homocysteine S-methyltransferase/methylenetetrahydrofolate reductase [Thermodesulfobacteriota bacterium]